MNKIFSSLLLIISVVLIQLPIAAEVSAAGAEKSEKPKRKTQLVGPSVGKKVAKAFEAYSADDIPGALVILLDIDASKDYDKAYVSRFIAVMYATMGDEEANAIKYLKAAVEPDLLNEGDHGAAIKLLADLQMQTKAYEEALVNYQAWMDFTGESDGNTWTKIANAHYALKQLDEMIVPADNAIAAYGDKQNKNPYILKITSFYENKKYKDAVKTLETVIQIFPEDKTWWTQLGMFYLLVEDYQKALQTLDLAYKQGFLVKESEIKTLASLYSQNVVPYKAAILLEKHIDSGLVPRDDKNLSSVANAWHAAQNIDKAAKYYGELAKMTNLAKHYSKQGMLLKQNEQFEPAIVALTKAIELGVKNEGRLQMSIAESHFYLEQYKQAYKAISLARKDPKTRKSAKGWESFIKDTARRKNVSI
ncbi:tetratricopeptide repeat protein [Colwellia sp. MB3u-70]|uniref:tetratricopeptide repeat protein n=1 Tax=unclassified Colwellia TaxID=196834 RepID=UPI0015F55ACB|nr:MULTISPECIES: tetratricopeptide repeat protein [unclassified Colwellia]MBA6292084.1 tetratricopeptide repeat protein [Colwellia sp. MB3u-8]MBA6309067.1 tetratricopeptide repeat protein [Colwellia sp. MB3u-70]